MSPSRSKHYSSSFLHRVHELPEQLKKDSLRCHGETRRIYGRLFLATTTVEKRKTRRGRRRENNNKCRNLERLKWRLFFFIPHSFGVEEEEEAGEAFTTWKITYPTQTEEKWGLEDRLLRCCSRWGKIRPKVSFNMSSGGTAIAGIQTVLPDKNGWKIPPKSKATFGVIFPHCAAVFFLLPYFLLLGRERKEILKIAGFYG